VVVSKDGLIEAAPTTPVRTVTTAVSGGMPPIFAAIATDIAALADFGANQRTVSGAAPSVRAIATTLAIAKTDLSTRRRGAALVHLRRHIVRRGNGDFGVDLVASNIDARPGPLR
jgi:hypothetical protein